MNEYTWIETMLHSEGFVVSAKLRWFLSADDETIQPFNLILEHHCLSYLEKFHKQFPSLRLLPFAQRGDRDEVSGIVLSDPVYRRGQVLLFDTEDIGHYIIDLAFSSLDAWVESTWKEIDDWHAA